MYIFLCNEVGCSFLFLFFLSVYVSLSIPISLSAPCVATKMDQGERELGGTKKEGQKNIGKKWDRMGLMARPLLIGCSIARSEYRPYVIPAVLSPTYLRS